ncbi:MAG: hypothetical protein JSW07_22150 [bacterium]|nr:MAG: hypothetical protein JSW07_22150 [bacterium]
MNLKEILQKIVDNKEPILLCDNNQEWEANVLLEKLSEPKLKVDAYLQSGLYIAEINPGGYLGQVLYRVKQKI